MVKQRVTASRLPFARGVGREEEVGEEERVGGEKRTKAGLVGQRSLLSAYALFAFAPRERELDAFAYVSWPSASRANQQRPGR